VGTTSKADALDHQKSLDVASRKKTAMDQIVECLLNVSELEPYPSDEDYAHAGEHYEAECEWQEKLREILSDTGMAGYICENITDIATLILELHQYLGEDAWAEISEILNNQLELK